MQSMYLEKVYYAGVRELRWSSGTPLEFLGLFRSFCNSSAIYELIHCEFWEDLKTGKAFVVGKAKFYNLAKSHSHNLGTAGDPFRFEQDWEPTVPFNEIDETSLQYIRRSNHFDAVLYHSQWLSFSVH